MRKKTLLLLLFYPMCLLHAAQTGRLLLNLDSVAEFSPEEFAQAAGAACIPIEKRNPYKAFAAMHLNEPFAVISPRLDEQALVNVAKRFGYRSATLDEATLEAAVGKASELLASVPQHSSEISYTDPAEAQRLYDLMEKVDRVFKAAKINYWATAGTLLGAVRHQGLIPWDDDLDVCLLEEEEPKLNEIHAHLERLGLKLYFHPHGYYKIFELNGASITDVEHPGQILPFKYPYADVFIMVLESRKEFQDIYVHKSHYSYWHFPDERYHYSQIEKLATAPFGPLMIPIPSQPEPYLNANYGSPQCPDLWKKYAIEPPWSHKLENADGAAGTCLVEIDDFSPAPISPP